MTQLALWPLRYPWSEPFDLLAKIRAEAAAGRSVLYQINGVSLREIWDRCHDFPLRS